MTAPLSFERCAALKAAGWPQRSHGHRGTWIYPNGTETLFEADEPPYGVYCPTLDELIDGCPSTMRLKDNPSFDGTEYEYSFTLQYRGPEWVAAYVQHGAIFRYDHEAANPRESVCDLWLSLPQELRVKP